jgi:hypothetical protein
MAACALKNLLKTGKRHTSFFFGRVLFVASPERQQNKTRGGNYGTKSWLHKNTFL